MLDWAGLAATTAGTALLYTLTGFGFAVLAAPLFLLLVDPQQAVQLTIIISTALSSSPYRDCGARLLRGCCCAWPSAPWPVAIRPDRLPLRRPGPGPRIGRSDNPRLCRASLVAAARPERTRWRLRHETRPRSR